MLKRAELRYITYYLDKCGNVYKAVASARVTARFDAVFAEKIIIHSCPSGSIKRTGALSWKWDGRYDYKVQID